ncbi:MAG TPA: hypothetical protein PKK12_09310 [Candidatus Aminicenantes bacterium]|nr:hypothetical protein [Candidatus Aminicenantes bacterium]
MNPRDRELDGRIGKLLQAGKPAYPEDLDRRLGERLTRARGEARPVPLRMAFSRRALRTAAAAAAVLVVAVLVWWSASGPRAPAVVPSPPAGKGVAAAGAPGAVPEPPPAMPTERGKLAPPPGTARGPKVAARLRGRRGAAPAEPIRLEFAIPERSITILWEQRNDFDLAALVAAR